MRALFVAMCLVFVSGCTDQPTMGTNGKGQPTVSIGLSTMNITEFTYQGHDYLIIGGGTNCGMMSHKGNCRSCQKQHNQ